jgi:hypothetical protein
MNFLNIFVFLIWVFEHPLLFLEHSVLWGVWISFSVLTIGLFQSTRLHGLTRNSDGGDKNCIENLDGNSYCKVARWMSENDVRG